jgi:serine/threonine protein kinase
MFISIFKKHSFKITRLHHYAIKRSYINWEDIIKILKDEYGYYISQEDISKMHGKFRNFARTLLEHIETLINMKKTFPIKTVCLIGYQMINVLEYIHNKHFVHRDLKPDNFVVGLNDLSKYLYLLDFGLAKKYRSSVTLKQYPLINKKKLTGTARYASINALRGFEQSRRDDLESAGYVLMYFLRGSLPWQGIPGKTKDERYKKILQKKNDTSAQELCEGFPDEFEKYIEYTRNMEYEEEPDYDKLRDYFIEVLEKQNDVFDYIYVWSTEEEKRMRKKEYLEEKHHIKKRKNTSKTNSVSHLATKLESTSNVLNNANNDEKEKEKEKMKRKERRQTTHNIKHLDEEENNMNRNSPQKKINYKFPTKENSFEGIKGIQDNNQQILNSPINETGRIINRTRTHNVKRKNSRIENDELKKENEEVCCTEACIII